MKTIKKITSSAIIIFSIILIIVFVGNQFTQNDEYSSRKNIQLINLTAKQEVDKINSQKIGNKKLISSKNNKNIIQNKIYRINPPNIDINNLVFKLNKPSTGSFTVSEVSKHNSRNNCYLIINNKVYNVSPYISYHPGGSEAIISRCGKDVTKIFTRIHSNRAWDLLKKYRIGIISSSTNKQFSINQILNRISNALIKTNPKADIINVKPKQNFYIAKIIHNKNSYEIHINDKGQIIKEETENNEPNWILWGRDNDDK